MQNGHVIVCDSLLDHVLCGIPHTQAVLACITFQRLSDPRVIVPLVVQGCLCKHRKIISDANQSHSEPPNIDYATFVQGAHKALLDPAHFFGPTTICSSEIWVYLS